jgi:hypothetical protein
MQHSLQMPSIVEPPHPKDPEGRFTEACLSGRVFFIKLADPP